MCVLTFTAFVDLYSTIRAHIIVAEVLYKLLLIYKINNYYYYYTYCATPLSVTSVEKSPFIKVHWVTDSPF